MRRPLLIALALVLALAPSASAREATEIAEAEPVPVFPVLGDVSFGGFANRFGGGRGHQGHDLFADCGTPIVAVTGGRVLESGFQGAAGNYVVLRSGDGRSHVYAHLRQPSPVKAGETVEPGRRLGSVGQTGNAWDCHLHFEIWTAPGWYRGGHAIDPAPYLRRLG